MQNLKPKLNEIANTIFWHIDHDKLDDINNQGIYAGSGGIILFLAHYIGNNSNERYESIYNDYLDILLQEITTQPQSALTYCSGLAGVFAGLRMMNDNSLIEIDFSEIEEAYNDKMWAWMNYAFANQNYDFLHGALGIAMYFRNNSKYIETALLWLERTAIKDDKKLKWISSLGQDRPMGYNICLSHGISSIIIYLSQVLQSGIMTELNRELLDGAVNYVISQEIDHDKYGCFFPSQSLENGEPIYKSRLAWCYGDLGVAAALWQAGRAAQNSLWTDKALEVYRFSALRTDYQDAMINDAGICHGAAGIAMMFSYMYRQTGDQRLMVARDYWIDQTLIMGGFADGLAGYKKFTQDEDKNIKWEKSFSVLEGIAGIGLMLLSIIDEEAGNNLFNTFALY